MSLRDNKSDEIVRSEILFNDLWLITASAV
jgi:hypothetical protein